MIDGIVSNENLACYSEALAVPIELITSSLINTAMFLEPRYSWAWFHKEIATALQDPNITRLIISLPPQHYKSTLIIRYLLNLLGNDPDGSKVAIGSYSASLSEEHSYEALKLFASPAYKQLFGLEIDPHQANKSKWGIKDHDGVFRAVGVGGSLFGMPCTHIVLDDVIKPTDAYSDAVCQAAETWYKTEVLTRLQDEHSKIICIGSRVAEDDFIGNRIKEGGWKVISFPAIGKLGNRYEAQPIDSLAAGVPLLKSMKFYLGQKEGMTDAEFETQFQGDPCPRGSLVLAGSELQTIDERCIPTDVKRVRSFDIASTGNTKSDQSATCLMLRDCAHREFYYIKECYGWKADWTANKKKIKEIILSDEPGTLVVIEVNGIGQAIYDDLKNDTDLDAYKIIPSFSKDDKMSRAMPWLGKAKDAKVKVIAGMLGLELLRNQLNHFTAHSKKDDLIDAISLAFGILARYSICPR